MSVLPSYRTRAEFTLRIVDEEESRALNKRWRGVDRPTNVLSFEAKGWTISFLSYWATSSFVRRWRGRKPMSNASG